MNPVQMQRHIESILSSNSTSSTFLSWLSSSPRPSTGHRSPRQPPSQLQPLLDSNYSSVTCTSRAAGTGEDATSVTVISFPESSSHQQYPAGSLQQNMERLRQSTHEEKRQREENRLMDRQQSLLTNTNVVNNDNEPHQLSEEQEPVEEKQQVEPQQTAEEREPDLRDEEQQSEGTEQHLQDIRSQAPLSSSPCDQNASEQHSPAPSEAQPLTEQAREQKVQNKK